MLAEPNCSKRRCKHYSGIINDGDETTERPACKIYPDGIPDDIAYGDIKNCDRYERAKYKPGDIVARINLSGEIERG